LMKLCSCLAGRKIHFEQLNIQKICASESVLISHLDSLDKLGLLIRQTEHVTPRLRVIENAQLRNKPTSGRFSEVLRKFLTVSKP
jgi:hypothetical protein